MEEVHKTYHTHVVVQFDGHLRPTPPTPPTPRAGVVKSRVSLNNANGKCLLLSN